MLPDQPLPVKYFAANALEKVLRVEKAMKMLEGSIDGMLRCYLDLMNEIDNEELIAAFENIMTIFQDRLAPFAIDVCVHLKNQYIRLIKQD